MQKRLLTKHEKLSERSKKVELTKAIKRNESCLYWQEQYLRYWTLPCEFSKYDLERIRKLESYYSNEDIRSLISYVFNVVKKDKLPLGPCSTRVLRMCVMDWKRWRREMEENRKAVEKFEIDELTRPHFDRSYKSNHKIADRAKEIEKEAKAKFEGEDWDHEASWEHVEKRV